MSKAAKQSIILLIVLLLACLGFAGYTYWQKDQLDKEKQSVENLLTQTEEREQKKSQQVKQLQEQLQKIEDEKTSLLGKVQAAEKKAAELNSKVDSLETEKETWERRADKASQARDELLAKITKLESDLKEAQMKQPEPEVVVQEKIVEKIVEKESPMTAMAPAADTMDKKERPVINIEQASVADEQYWAGLLKEKAALEIEIERMKEEMSKSSIEVVQLKQENENLKIQIDQIKNEKDDIAREIKYKEDLVNNLSLELARTKNDKKFVADRVEKINAENMELRTQMKKLVASKGALEKTIVRLTEEKNEISKKLGRTESIIQSKIDEIWEIKDSLDRSFKESKMSPQSTNSIELPPIIVNSDASNSFNTGESSPGFEGKVVSVNTENNFVIVDLGEKAGMRLGEQLSVYRDGKYIARLEVIQVRGDISAADIKDQWTKIQAGDTIR